MKKLFIQLSTALLSACMLTSCYGNSEILTDDTTVNINFDMELPMYNGEGYWVDAYDPEINEWGILIGYNVGVLFTHKAEVTNYDGVKYKSFTGFVPSIVDDKSDHTGQDWTQFQFGCMASATRQGYVIAHWDVRENESTELKDRSCLVEFGYTVRPVALTITNTTYAYWAMMNGTNFSKPFTDDDYLAVDIWGVNQSKETFFKTIYLAEKGKFVDNWQNIDLTGMGDVQEIYFTMRSSDSGEWGMNTPAYFALGSITVVYPGNKG